MRSYQARLRGNQLEWLDGAPDSSSDMPLTVEVVVFEDVPPTSARGHPLNLPITAVDHPEEDADLLAAARQRGVVLRERLLAAEGGTLSAEEAGTQLGMSVTAIGALRQARKLLALEVTPGSYRFPAWQFRDAQILSGLDRVLAAFTIHDAWMQAAFFLSPNLRLGGETPLAALRRGTIDGVLRAARSYGEHGAA